MTRPATPRRGRPRSTHGVNGQRTNPDDSVVTVQVDAAAKQAMDELCDRRGMTLTAAASRLIQWLVTQDEITQAWVLNRMSRESLSPMSGSAQERTARRHGRR